MTSMRGRWAGVLLGLMLLGGGRTGMAAPLLAGELEAADKPLQVDPLLDGAQRFEQGAKNVTEVNLDKNMLAMAARFMEKGDGEGKELMKKMDFVYVRSYEYAKPGAYRMEDVAQFRGRLDESKWSHVVKERSEKDATDVWMKADNDGQLSELLVIAAEPMGLTFVHLKGRMSMDELTKAGASYGVPQGDTRPGKRGK